MRLRLAVSLILACLMSSAYAQESRIQSVWFPAPLRSLSPEQLAHSFLVSKAKDLGVDPQALKLVKSQESLLAYHLVYQQNANDLPIENAALSLSILKREHAVYRYYSTLLPSASPPMHLHTITEDQAYDAAWAYIGVQDQLFQAPQVQLRYVQSSKGLTLVYSVDLSPKAPYGVWQVDVDASTGAVMNVRDLRINEKAMIMPSSFGTKVKTIDRRQAFANWRENAPTANAQPSEWKEGNASIFDPDPLTELGSETITDSSPAFAFDQAYVHRILPEISLSDGVYSLTGPWVKIVDFDPPAVAVSTTKDGTWKFRRGQGGFNDSMTYFHLDQSQRYIQSLGFKGDTGIQFGPLEADADGANGADNSYYLPSTNRLAFGHGCVDDNEDADVILHEYGHALQFSINPNFRGGDTGGMGEGFGDYWAASYSYATAKGSDFHPARVYNWDAGNCWPGRGLDALDARYNHETTYGAHKSIGGGYQSDELWSTPLFQAHLALRALNVPREEIDTIVLEAQFGMGAALKMRDMAKSIVNTAKRLYPKGPHAAVFRQKFFDQGILLEPKAVLVATFGKVEAEDGILDPGEQATILLKVENTGDKLASGVSASVTTDDAYVSGLSADFTLGELAEGQSRSVKFNFAVDANAPCGHVVAFKVTLKSIDGTSSTIPVQVLVGKMIEVLSDRAPNLSIPEDKTGISDQLELTTDALLSPAFAVKMNIKHSYIGDLKVTLVSPEGKELVLHSRGGSGADNINGTYPTTLTPQEPLSTLVGASLQGIWTLKVVDSVALDFGSLVSWGIRDVIGYECH